MPATATAGSPALTVTLTGAGFVSQSSVTAGGMALATTFVNATQLTAVVPQALVASVGMLSIVVSTPPPGGGTSAARTLTIVGAGVVTPTNHPQVARYSISAPRDATVTIEFGPTTNYGLRTGSKATPPGGGTVEILVAGMRAFTLHHLRARVEFPDGVTHVDADHAFTTGGLPPELRPAIVVAPPGALAPNSGVQLLDLIGGDPKVRAVVTDLEGNILWYYDQLTGFPSPIQFLPNGDFLLVDATLVPGSFDTVLREVDLAGDTVREVTASQLNQRLAARGFEPVAGEFHHDVILLPNGHLMALTLFHREFTDVAGFEGQTIDVVGDALVELDADLQPVWVWSAFDHLDVNRHPFGFPDPRLGFDWTHANAIVYTPADRNLILSLRHQHWVIKIDYQDGFGSGQVLWRFGAEGDFALLNGGAADFSYAQHFPNVLDPQAAVYRMAVFDNGNDRPFDEMGTPCDPQAGRPCFSRAVIYEMDEAMKTARMLWEDRFGIYAPFLGSVQLFANGNVLWDAGTVSGAPTAVVREVTQEASPQTVWQMDVTGQFVYRSLRLPSLYPDVRW